MALGSVKSNIGHLKGAAGAAGMLKAALALRDKVLAAQPALRASQPRYRLCPLSALRQYRIETVDVPADGVRRAGVSAFGFGGTNFHAVLEEYIPGRLNGNGKRRSRSAMCRLRLRKEL